MNTLVEGIIRKRVDGFSTYAKITSCHRYGSNGIGNISSGKSRWEQGRCQREPFS